MNHELPRSDSTLVPVLALVGASVLAAGLFLLVPLTQTLDARPPETVTYRQIAIAPPPPPRPSPPPSTTAIQDRLPRPKPPVLEQEVAEVETTRLEFSLAPGMGVPMAMGSPSMPAIQRLNTVQAIKDIFNFDEVDDRPTPLNARQIRIDYPRELSRRGIHRVSVVLEVLIDKAGRVTVKRMLSSTHAHPRVETVARRAAEQIRFTVAKKNGRPVSVLGRFPLELEDPRRR